MQCNPEIKIRNHNIHHSNFVNFGHFVHILSFHFLAQIFSTCMSDSFLNSNNVQCKVVFYHCFISLFVSVRVAMKSVSKRGAVSGHMDHTLPGSLCSVRERGILLSQCVLSSGSLIFWDFQK